MKHQKDVEKTHLFKGATREATLMGVPVYPLGTVFIVIATLSLLFSLWFWLVLPPFIFIMAQITKYDDRAFRIIGLYLETRFRNKNKHFWQASSYTPTQFRKRKI